MILVHYSLFAVNGYGLSHLYMPELSAILEIVSQSLFMLLLLLLAMGWAVTRYYGHSSISLSFQIFTIKGQDEAKGRQAPKGINQFPTQLDG